MTSTNEDMKRFYEKIGQLKDVISNILTYNKLYTDQEELNKYYTLLDTVKNVNHRKPIEFFYKICVIPYVDHIVTMNDVLFKEVNDELANRGLDNGLILINKIKNVWELIDDSSKSNIWQYLRIISMLSERVSGGNTLMNAIKVK